MKVVVMRPSVEKKKTTSCVVNHVVHFDDMKDLCGPLLCHINRARLSLNKVCVFKRERLSSRQKSHVENEGKSAEEKALKKK